MDASSPARPGRFRPDQYDFQEGDALFFDTNIWLFLLDPFGDPSDSRIVAYSAAYKRILKARCALFTDDTVVGEFINRALKLGHEADIRHGLADPSWKRYRTSDEFGYSLERTTALANEILSACQLLHADPDWPQILSDMKQRQRDLNDEILVRICQHHDLILVTDDGDFTQADLDIISANSAFFRRR